MQRFIRAAVAGALLAGCTKANPASDCAADGLCHSSEYPYCDADGAIGGEPGKCIAVICAPGTFGACDGSASALYCNASGNGYDSQGCAFGCDTALNICKTSCTVAADCQTAICKADGTCATDAEIAYVVPAGSSTSDCSKTAPCTLEHALQLQAPPSGQYVKLASGNYLGASTLHLNGRRTLLGVDAASTSVHISQPGPIFSIDAGADVTFDSLQIADAVWQNSPLLHGYGIDCPAGLAGPRTITVVNSLVTNNAESGLYADGCAVTLLRSRFINDGPGGEVQAFAATTIDSCVFEGNPSGGLFLWGTTIQVTNSVIARNPQRGVELTFGAGVTPVFNFNTIVDNGIGVDCETNTTGVFAGDNNIIARNQPNTAGTGCDFMHSLVASDVTALKFVSPDVAPYDYHLAAGSTAIDAAQGSATTDHDMDGELRPKGTGRDLGADEY